MDNIEEVKKKLLKGEEIKIQPVKLVDEVLEDFRRDFPKKNKTQDFREACDKLKKDFHVVLNFLKKRK
jgi:predicted ATP-dependent protease